MMREPIGPGAFLSVIVAIVGVLAVGTPATAQQEQTQEPDRGAFLTLDTGMHVGPITRIATDRAGVVVVTGSADKSIRVFSAEDGRQIRKIHLPLGEDLIGAVTGLAVSPDGRRILAATVSFDSSDAFDEGSLYVIDTASGDLLGRVRKLPAAPHEVRFTPDGRLFAMALGAHGFEVRAANGKRLFADRERSVAAMAVSDALMVTLSFDSELRWFALEETGVTEVGSTRIRKAGQPFSMALSPDDGRVAVGYQDRMFVDVIDLRAKSKVRLMPPESLASDNLALVTWTKGREPWLVAGGTTQTLDLQNVLLGWRGGRAGKPFILPIGGDAITDLVSSGENSVVVATADPLWARVVIETGGMPRLAIARRGERLDFRQSSTNRFELSRDGEVVVFSDRDIRRPPLQFDLGNLELSRDPPLIDGGVSPDLELLSARLGTWQYSVTPELDGRLLMLDQGERVLAADIDAVGETVVLGTDYRLRLYSAAGVEVAQRRLTSAAWMVALVPDRPLVVAGLGDGTLRWYSLRDDLLLEEVAGLFVHADMRRWVAWRSDGLFAHSDFGGEELVGYQQNGTTRAPTGTWLSFDQAYRSFHDPEAVSEVLRDDASWPMVAGGAGVDGLFGGLASRSVSLEELCPLDEMPGKIESRGVVLAAGASTIPDTEPAEGCIEVGSEAIVDRGGGLTRTVDFPTAATALRARLVIEGQVEDIVSVDAFVDGRNVGRVELAGANAPFTASEDGSKLTIERVVPLSSDRATLVFRARGRDGIAVDSDPIVLQLVAEPPERGPKLYVLAVGVDEYRGEVTPLNFAVADATTFARTVAAAKPDAYADIETITLLDQDATRSAVVDAMQEIAGKAQPGDAVLIYLAGHGVTSEETGYIFVTSNVTTGRGLAEEALDHATLSRWLAEIPAENVLVVLDTCYAGAFDLKAPANLAQEVGYFVLTGSSSVEEALDSYNDENGVLAHAVKQGLLGQAASPDGYIDALQLGVYARRAVPKLAAERNHKQSAVFKAAGGDLKEFPIASVSSEN